MKWYEVLLILPLGFIGFAASIAVPMFIFQGMNKLAERLIVDDAAKLEKVKKLNENIMVAIYISAVIAGSIYFS